jgi:hypothetical protein
MTTLIKPAAPPSETTLKPVTTPPAKPKPVGYTPSPAKPLSTDQASAKDAITSFLGQYGLEALGTFAWNEYLNGTPLSQIMLDIRKTPEYQARFPAMATLAQNGQAMTEQQYMSLEQSYRDIFHSYGLPAGFYDQPADFAKFMEGNVSPAELQSRVQAYTTAVSGDTETLNQLSKLYGDVGHSNNPQGDLLAHYLDPNAAAPLLAQQLAGAQFASAGVRSGFGQVTAAQALQYGAQAGTTAAQAEQGFGALVHGRELMTGLPGENQGDISQQTQLGAEFGGSATDQEVLSRRAQLRVAEGSGGGGFSQNRRGNALGTNEV